MHIYFIMRNIWSDKLFIFFFVFIVFPFPKVNAQRIVCIDDNWKFHFGNASNPSKDFNYGIATVFSKAMSERNTAIDQSFNDSAWRSVNLPHDWAVELPFAESSNYDVAQHGYKPIGGLFPETSIGWYRKHFSLSSKDSGQRFHIQFDGVFRDASFWINGFYLGNNKSGYMGVSYDITDFLNFNKENVLVVRVDAVQYEGWFYEGAGIYRHVWLKKVNNIHVADDGIFLHSSVTGNKAVIAAETEIENKSETLQNITVQTCLLDRGGKKIICSAEQKIIIPGEGAISVNQNLSVYNPHLWSLDDPYLYRVAVTIKQNGKLLDEVINRYGIRTITVKPGGVFLNGKHIKIKGTNNHQDHAGVGSALPDFLQYYRIRLLKDMGCNSIRTSHNPPTPELLDACDSLGMLVLDETRLLNSGTEYIQQFKKLLYRDRSRTCVYMWSIGNEEAGVQRNSHGKRIAETLVEIQKRTDPSRTCTYAADMGNEYNGINEIIPVRGFNYREYSVADYHRDHPLHPIIGTEMGSTVTTRGIYEKDTVRCYVPDIDSIAPWWASKAETWWKLAAENNYWLGGYIWTGFDYRGEPTPYQWPNINSHFGVMDVCGFPKNIYYYYQSWWSDKDVLHISPHWNWKGKEGQPVKIWIYSNADEVELFINEKSLGKKLMPRNSHLQWTVNYEPGILKAVAYKGKRTFSAKQETSDEAAGINTVSYKTTMLADGRDVTVINISAVDKNNREVPDANNLISFTIKGDAKILGVGNGDPSSHEPDICEDGKWQRKLFNGKCQVIVQSGKNSDTIVLEAKSNGLWNGVSEIFSIPAQQATSYTQAQQKVIQPKKETGRIIGADISALPELEDRGIKFSDNGIQKDAVQLLKDHGFNYIRLRIFNNPSADSGYAPGKGFCDLTHTLAMAKRIKNAGMKLLLDFHYSDYWADPGKQYKPAAWKNLPLDVLKDSVYAFTKRVMLALKEQGTVPDMVQVGNEINHAMIWPDGHVNDFNGLAVLFKAGADAVRNTSPNTAIMLHVALGGQNNESVFFIDNMLARGVQFDVIGESYYPQWHGTLDDLKNNLYDLIKRYNKDVIVVEYTFKKEEVNDIVFGLPDGKGKGTFIWEPLSTWEYFVEPDGKSNSLLKAYDTITRKYLTAE